MNRLNNSDWLSHMYDVNTAASPANELDCLNLCLNVQRTTCDFFVYVDATCYLGNYDTFKNITYDPTFGCKKNVTVKIKKGKYQLKYSDLF